MPIALLIIAEHHDATVESSFRRDPRLRLRDEFRQGSTVGRKRFCSGLKLIRPGREP